MGLFDNKQKVLIISIFILTFLILVGSSVAISNYNALQATADETEQEIEDAIDQLSGSNAWSIVTLVISLLVLLGGAGYLGYDYYKLKMNL